ncbi:hypothetical protein TraAM80_06304 [Trypanosoma rangeli]|uniref:WW domain-containing protein n=1 Tax=Trypanosoma rangeli TaxID=5698 RepID=A0A422NAT8_TRYRA|nr:uncharacterized protein TraAM80_06304 [Trypanosoma rangeli]RNF02571.1 hypothetical protein TraAM80_06304 [Trypanosoma rangeli]|eukprot:RNF02571.1 hypothetical protein TraAM80_06304 [Trypanosoma rangeli]
MEYTCVVAGDPIVGVDALMYLLVDTPLPQELRAQQQQQSTPSSLSSAAAEKVLIPLRRTLDLPHPSLPELKIRVVLQAARAPSDMAVEETATVVLLVFFMAFTDSLQRMQMEWTPPLQGLSRPPIVILVGMTHAHNKAAPTTIQPGEVAHVAKEVHAKAYFEVDETDNNTIRGTAQITELRHAIARACTGEFNEMETVTEATIYEQQQCAVLTSSLQSFSPRLSSPDSASQWTANGWSSGLARAAPCPVWGFRRNPRTNRLFYVNRVIKKSQYKRPPDYDGEEPELTLQERVEAERERQEQLQLENALRREHDELGNFNVAMEEHHQRVRVLQSGARQLQLAVERLRMQAASLACRRESNRVSREHMATLREVSVKERDFLQDSLQFHATQQKERGAVQQALKEMEAEANEEGCVNREESEREKEVAAQCSATAPSRRGSILGKIHVVQAATQQTMDSTRVTVAALRALLEKSAKHRERKAILHAELSSTLKRTESLVQRTAVIDAEEQRVGATLVTERDFMQTETKALQLLVDAREVQLQRGRNRLLSPEVEGFQVMLLTDEVHQLEEQIAATKKVLRRLQKATPMGVAHELALLHRRRNTQACATALATWANHVRCIARLQKKLSLRVERLSDLMQRRYGLICSTRERYVEERLSLLHDWYRLDAEVGNSGGFGDVAARMHLVEERMDQLDTSLERLQTYMATIEHHSSSHQLYLQRCRGILEKLSLCNTDVFSLKSDDEVESCGMLLVGRLREVTARLHSVAISMGTLNTSDGDDGDAFGEMGVGASAVYAGHIKLLQRELWRSAVRSLLCHFRPEELQETARRLSRRHALRANDNSDKCRGATNSTSPKRVMTNTTSADSSPVFHCNVDGRAAAGHSGVSLQQPDSDSASASTSRMWMEQQLLSVLASVTGGCGLDTDEATVTVEGGVLTECPVSYDALRERLRRVYA